MFFAGWKRRPLPDDEAATRYEMRGDSESSDRVEWKDRRGGGEEDDIREDRGHGVLFENEAKSLSLVTGCSLLQVGLQALRRKTRGVIGSNEIVAEGR